MRDVVVGEHKSDRQNDGRGKFENGRRNGVFIGGVGGGAVSQRGNLPIGAGEKQVNVSPTRKLSERL